MGGKEKMEESVFSPKILRSFSLEGSEFKGHTILLVREEN
jgi:hypothetical protein